VIRVVLPQHLRTLAGVSGTDEVEVDVGAVASGAAAASAVVTLRAVLDALEAKYPVLRGTIRDHVTARRRDFVRFFVCGDDVSLESADMSLPDAVIRGDEPVMIIGAIAGG
jgi:hypothetical protein